MKLTRAEEGVLVGRLMLRDGACRAAGSEKSGRGIRGIAAPWDSFTVLYESPSVRIREQYARGCFDKSLKGDKDVRCMFNHEPMMILGRRGAKTLTLRDTDDGLEYEVEVNGSDPMAVGVYARVSRGDVAGASCWFMPTDVEKRETRLPDGRLEIEETIREADLYECGPVTDGAYSDATAAARGIVSAFEAAEKRARQAEYDEFMRRLEAAGG